MANVMDYIKWRGDIDMEHSPFNDVDNLLFSMISFIDFDGIVPDIPCGFVTLGKAAEMYFERTEEQHLSMGMIVPDEIICAFEEMSSASRYRNIKVTYFVDKTDVGIEQQFSAVTFILPNDSGIYIAFRGTDDTLVGWKEDFNMSFMNSIPSQLEAVKYVNRACRSLGYPDTVIGGHSKGGNLAVYGGAFCDDMAKRCITRIYSNDGPGFSKQVAESEEYKSVQDRIMRIIPQTSIVGMLFENPARCCVVQSNQRGVLQHDGFSWQVMGGKFVFLDNVTEDCRIIKNTISEWLEECTGEQLNEIVNALFTFLSSTDAATLTELSANTPKLLGSIRRMDSVNKKYLLRLVRLMAGVEKRKIRHEIQKQLFGQGGGH